MFFLSVNIFAQTAKIEFQENKGQWQENILYKAHIPGGELYLEKNELTYLFYDEQDIARFSDLHHGAIKNPKKEDYLLDLHAFKVTFLPPQQMGKKAGFNQSSSQLIPALSSPDYVNYYLGNDSKKWASHVNKYQQINYQKLYENIELQFYTEEQHLKYDFKVLPGGNVNDIRLQYAGADRIYLKDGSLHIKTSVNELVEQKPYAYQWVNGKKKEVKSKFKLTDNVLSFEFPEGYNKEALLVIDPVLVFASYSGSTVDNWGYTSTFDNEGNTYGGGVAFGLGYPTTIGAYQVNFAGGGFFGGTDISISKFSPDGTTLIYSTYIGGADAESPHSLIVNNNNELLILGTTSSNDFPVSVGAYDVTFNGGSFYMGTLPYYLNGSDIVVSKLSADGTALLSSTFMGGTENDGLNMSGNLKYNYGDVYRGEIIVDANDNVYVASTTLSTNFPTTAGVFLPSNGGGQDGCVFKLSSDLSSLIWSSYLGGTGNDAAYSLQFDSTNNLYVTGGTESADFPTTAGTIHPTFQGGVSDGFISKTNNNATTILASSYLGTNAYDQSYFVQLDTAENVYVIGQTEGVYPITPATVYNVPNSGQFLHKLTPDLTSTVFSTSFGRGNAGKIDIALSAFLVNDCNYILISGWGGATNRDNAMASESTTSGLPVTANAIQSTTDGSDYYLMMLSEDADTLLFATFFGGNLSEDHVDGGTSRFDKKGIVYQAVCASCGFFATSDFPTTTDAWSTTNNSTNCNLGVFKIDLTSLTADVELFSSIYFCLGDTTRFQNLSNGGNRYSWDFGDSSTSTLFEPTHVYDSVGTYKAKLTAFDSLTCIQVDLDSILVHIIAPPVATIGLGGTICKGDSTLLSAGGGTTYQWSPNYNISDTASASPTVWPDTTTTYTVIVFDTCGSDTESVTISIFPKYMGIQKDTNICITQSAQLNATGGVGASYLWSPSATLNNATISNPIAIPSVTTTYSVTITDINNCVWDTFMTLNVDPIFPLVDALIDTSICFGDSVQIYASGGFAYLWTPDSTLINANTLTPVAFPSETTNYTVAVTNGCDTYYKSTLVIVNNVPADISNDTLVCVGEQVFLSASGGGTYLWTPSEPLTDDKISSPQGTIYVPVTFTVQITDIFDCIKYKSVFVDTLTNPVVNAGEDIETEWKMKVTFTPETNGIFYLWTPSLGLSCTTCLNPVVRPEQPATYVVTVSDINGCTNADTISVFIGGAIFLPNSFTPNGDGDNDVFYAYGKDIVEFELHIFDRWGEELFYSDDINNGWDGTVKGRLAETETYVWMVIYKDVLGEKGKMYGRVTLFK